ncbi:UvrD/REP helicase [Stutzerimonas stutzeri ATCC 14405 = CCUG 16156]|uniref:UvrD-helicase domain-containing protein n=1 Tax=Stutzerimonas stutzeri TaxID=316 RepID=UPI0002549956|nr:ATP-dependent helicase [Stutzerimonas stutzeri]EHY77860.1 UvrD/REP helicase [Stutzerimonas stutzeri ATCC 14405 = CCUG 16156]QOZ96017.1 ATP-dependent helicase [Stutzerimonas stutzeri]
MTPLTPEQRAYIRASLSEHVYLRACPGSGKTEVVAAMIANASRVWQRSPSGIAVLTFSNSATDELKDRLHEHLGEALPHPHRVSTFDSFLLNHVVGNIATHLTGYPGRDGDYRIRLLDKSSNIYLTRTKIGERRISACKYDYDIVTRRFEFTTGDLTEVKLNAVEQSPEMIDDLTETKRRFWRGGFATYRDIDMLALKALRDAAFEGYFAKVVRRFPIVVIDECQDLSAEQLSIVRQLARRGMKFHFVGDLNQSIYGFRKSDPARVRILLEELNFTEYALTANWRSGQAIVDLCSDLLRVARSAGNPGIEPLKPLLIQYQECPSELTPKITELTHAYQNVVVVARGYTTLQRFTRGTSELAAIEELALSCVLIESQNLEEVRQALKLFAEWLASKLSFDVSPGSLSCPIQVESNLEWRQFIFQCLKFLSSCGASNLELTWKEWAAQTKRVIQSLPDQLFVPRAIVPLLEGLRGMSLSAPAGKGADALAKQLLQVGQQSISNHRVATIHQVKGESHDATVLLSSLKAGSQGNWKDWLQDPLSEAARFAYVASSRPRHLLIWGVKALKPDERDRIAGLGFEIVD